jgi:membrane protease YdiL (CAAX protease family)
MIVGNEIGIGPAIRVLRHFTERRRYYQIKFASGEQALLLIAGMPAPSVEVVRLALGGLVPWQTVWEYNPTRAGGYSDYIHKLKAMFSPTTGRSDDSFHYIRDALLPCQSIEEARTLLLERERRANSATNEIADGFTRRGPRSVTSNDGWELGFRSPQHGPSAVKVKPDVINQNDRERGNGKPEPFYAENLDRAQISTVPNRYRIRNDDQGRVLTCVEAPMVMVRAERKVAISAKQARNYPAGAIFLDGAAQGDPFVDVQKDLYNLDHHEGCIRSLATCEQAMVLVRKSLDLRKRDWVVLANDADLDTLLAVWVLLNHLRLNDDSEVRAKVMPLLRLEGVIDTHGFDVQDLAAFPPDLLHSTSAMLKQIRQQEIEFKRYGRWSEIDLLEYIADRLRAVDELIYSPEVFEDLHEIEELARAEIANGSVAVACRSDAGMDEVERQLQRIYGQRLGILIFQNSPSTYRVRQVDPSLPATLERAYERLNLLDPAATSGPENRWGGSPATGVSPRKTGTGLIPTQIIEAVRETFWEPTLIDIVSAIPRAIFLAVAALSPALALIFVGNLLRDRGYIAGEAVLLSAVVLTITVGILFWSKARRVPGLYGLRVPAGFGWLSTLPAGLIGALTGGAWAPESLAYRMGPDNHSEFTGLAALLFPLGAELLFRGVILGHLASRLPIQKSGDPWWRSWPTLISTGLYAGASLLLLLSFSTGQMQMSQGFLIVGGAVIFGIASGIARERSESILSSVLLHWICVAALFFFNRLLF